MQGQWYGVVSDMWGQWYGIFEVSGIFGVSGIFEVSGIFGSVVYLRSVVCEINGV